MCIVSIASLFDPSLAPPGQHTVHVYCAANEPWGVWEGQQGSTKQYKELKVSSFRVGPGLGCSQGCCWSSASSRCF